MDLGRVLALLDDFLHSAGIDYAVIGGVALQAYGVGRATFDLDLVADAGAQARVVAHLESLAYETLHVSPGYSNHLHPEAALGRVDFVYVGGETSRLLLDQRRKWIPFEGRSIAVARAEYVAAMKVWAIKNDPTRRELDLGDIERLLRVPGTDRDEIRGFFEKLGLREDFDGLAWR